MTPSGVNLWTRSFAVVALVFGACNLPYPADVGPDAAPDASPNPIIGHSIVTHVLVDGSVVMANEDLSGYKVQAYVPDASAASGYDVIDGAGDANGTVTVDNVPFGMTYALALTPPVSPEDPAPAPSFYFTSQRSLDLGYVALGRPQSVPVVATTPVTLNVSNMTPWGVGADTLWVDSLATNSEHEVAGANATTNGPTAGATSINGTTFDWHDPNMAIPTPPHEVQVGDDFMIDHTSAVSLSLDDAVVWSVVDHADASGVVVRNGIPAAASAAFVDVPQSATQSFRFDIPVLENAAGCAGGAGSELATFQRVANPAANYGLSSSPALLGASVSVTPHNRIGVEMDGLGFGDPYPSTWPQLVSASFDCWRINDADLGGALYVASEVQLVEAAAPSIEIPGGVDFFVPAPANVKVGGVPGARGGTLAFDGTHAFAVAWDAVAGRSSYEVRLLRLDLVSELVVATVVASFHTTETSVVVPPSVVQPGGLYIVLIGTHNDSSGYAAGVLRRMSFPRGSAFVATGEIRMSALCGNHAIDPGEACDGGGDTPTCDADCTKVACGDGYVNAAAGEQCDWGAPVPCDRDCTPVVCGDGTWTEAFEECDDGNTRDDGNGCSASCALNKCGDGVIQGPWESCDDGNGTSGDGCSHWCQIEPGWQCTGAPSQCQPN